MSRAEQQIDVWVGHFRSKKDFDRYFEERYSDDDEPISLFARDQGVQFYDHDFMERSHHELTRDPAEALERHRLRGSFVQFVRNAFRAANVHGLTSLVLFWNAEIPTPSSVAGDDFSLTYLGRFACSSDSIAKPVDDFPPVSIALMLGDGSSKADSIPVSSAGIILGSGGCSGEHPYFDLSGMDGAGDLAEVQAVITVDQFGQWILEDRGDNGLTSIDGHILNGEKTFPWEGSRIALGKLQFRWVGQESGG